ncbi:hypothetical protein [Halopenitus malekzadehii]|uniref:hypothetical protein n=1 Tax=Halopenitus malekzadehii TaxID=1267564 RepID=UPI00115FD7E7|nr:hypothetical protein [Halopenitus malekzadehii]
MYWYHVTVYKPTVLRPDGVADGHLGDDARGGAVTLPERRRDRGTRGFTHAHRRARETSLTHETASPRHSNDPEPHMNHGRSAREARYTP